MTDGNGLGETSLFRMPPGRCTNIVADALNALVAAGYDVEQSTMSNGMLLSLFRVNGGPELTEQQVLGMATGLGIMPDRDKPPEYDLSRMQTAPYEIHGDTITFKFGP